MTFFWFFYSFQPDSLTGLSRCVPSSECFYIFHPANKKYHTVRPFRQHDWVFLCPCRESKLIGVPDHSIVFHHRFVAHDRITYDRLCSDLSVVYAHSPLSGYVVNNCFVRIFRVKCAVRIFRFQHSDHRPVGKADDVSSVRYRTRSSKKIAMTREQHFCA